LYHSQRTDQVNQADLSPLSLVLLSIFVYQVLNTFPVLEDKDFSLDMLAVV